MKYDENLEIAVLYKKVNAIENKIGECFIPYKVIEGYYCDDDESFYDLEGTQYKHLIMGPENIGYLDRISFNKRINHNITKKIVFNNIMKKRKNIAFLLVSENENNMGLPVIMYSENNTMKMFCDTDTYLFYDKYYPYEFGMIDGNDKITLEMWSIDAEEEEVKSLDVEVDYDVNIADIYKKITDVIIDQDEPIRKILTAVWKQNNHYSNRSRNILINGGTGVGKTEIFRLLSKLLNVPCVITSATQYSATGYVGGNVEDMLVSLVNKAEGDIDLAEHGILIIDEVDKISEVNKGSAQVNQRSVQESLLKILEDAVITIDTDYGEIDFDTSKLMVIAMGSWTMAKVDDNKSIGFNSEAVKKKDYKKLTREDMLNNGLIPDFVGRFNTIIQMNDLNYDSFIKILNNSKNSMLRINKEFLNNQGITFTIEDGTCEEIARKASKSRFGARELDNIVENALAEASFEIATNPDKYSELIINKDTIDDNKKYKLVLKDKNTCIK